jgi:hypothetical protein
MYQPGLSCLKKIVLVIFVSLLGTNLGVAGGGDKLAPSSRGNNTRVREFTFERQVSKTNRDFLVREEGGNNVLQVTSRFNRPGSYVSFQMTVTNSYMHSFAIGIEVSNYFILPSSSPAGQQTTPLQLLACASR